MRKRIFDIVEVPQEGDKASHAYDLFMMIVIVASIVPLAFKTQTLLFQTIDRVSVIVFIIDYLLRLFTADYKFPKLGKAAFIVYPISPMAIVDLLAILPSIAAISSGLRLLRLLRLFRTFRVFRVFKIVRYSKNITMILHVFSKEKFALISVGSFALAYILVSALVVFSVEPDSFETFFEAVYWATVSLTTVGYGDIYPVTTTGRIVTMVSSLLGIAIVALPAGIITAGYMSELSKPKDTLSDQ
ncbi:MAG: ion transporter [Eubacteriales bacterium]|jgi:voltage-gated potassium channel|nr:ion transporter [Eubacteriales bacterium]